jgi:uncharacterized protein YbjT (DUF2867 family)
MKVLLFGATGMVGQGVLRECLRDPGVDEVDAIGRSSTGVRDIKFNEIVHPDLSNYTAVEDRLRGFDACFFCLGVSSAGMSEPDYERVTYGFTIAAADTLSRLNPGMVFIYVSGAGTDSTEKGRVMWARVKGRSALTCSGPGSSSRWTASSQRQALTGCFTRCSGRCFRCCGCFCPARSLPRAKWAKRC